MMWFGGKSRYRDEYDDDRSDRDRRRRRSRDDEEDDYNDDESDQTFSLIIIGLIITAIFILLVIYSTSPGSLPKPILELLKTNIPPSFIPIPVDTCITGLKDGYGGMNKLIGGTATHGKPCSDGTTLQTATCNSDGTWTYSTCP